MFSAERWLDNTQTCPWEWDSHGKCPMEWDGTVRIAFPMNDNECQNDEFCELF